MGNLERFDFMKASRIFGPVLLIAGCTGLFGWLARPQPAAPVRIEVESEAADSVSLAGQASFLSYDPYFIHVNDFRQILIPASQAK